MSACAVQPLNGTVSISLGLRVGVIGSDAFTNWVRGAVQRDSDVTSVSTSTGLECCASGQGLNLLIVESGCIGSVFLRNFEEAAAAVSLVGVSGTIVQGFAAFSNVIAVDLMDPNWWHNLKQQTVQRRFHELYTLINALAADSEALLDREQVLTLEDGGTSSTIPISSVDWIRAAGNYVEIRVNGRSHLLRMEMHSVQRRLTQRFLRIHRRVIINTQRLVSLEPGSGARLFAILATGDRFPVSRARRQLVQSHWEELRQYKQ